MSRSPKLLVVESGTKIKKLGSILNKYEAGRWEIIATGGHWRGLPEMDGQDFSEAVDPATWRERWAVHKHRTDTAARLKAAIAGRSEENIYLAADGDREGEAIAWHICDAFGLKNPQRAVFEEITTKAVIAAVENPKPIDMGLVHAQRARAVLDYMLGMNISRRLWRFGGKSAGRLQSCVLRMLVTRERAIRDFETRPFWTVEVALPDGLTVAVGTLTEKGAVKPTRYETEEDARAVVRSLGSDFVLERAERKKLRRRPPRPFTTLDMLGVVSERNGISVAAATAASQSLFEAGHVSYIRTDSVTLSGEAVSAAREYLGAHFGHLLPSVPVVAENGANAQAAHEAIRPTTMVRAPANLRDVEQVVYDAIFTRTLASQALPAELERTTYVLRPECGAEVRLLAQGTVVTQSGWLEVDEGAARPEDELPVLQEGARCEGGQCDVKRGETRPPPRWSEKTLAEYLEKRGIGRPSTFAGMVTTLQERGYVELKKTILHPLDLGFLADELVTLGYDEISKEGYTARTEASLDLVEKGALSREEVLDGLYKRYRELDAKAVLVFEKFAAANPERDNYHEAEHESPCPACGSAMKARHSKRGRYAYCTGMAAARP